MLKRGLGEIRTPTTVAASPASSTFSLSLNSRALLQWRYLLQCRTTAKTPLKYHNRKITDSAFEEVTDL